MTDSASNPGREDVLTQVRKLVSAAPPSSPRSAAEGRLLLTPALRVTDPAAKAETDVQPSRRVSLEDRIAELEAAVGNESNEWEPDGSEGIEPHRPDAVIYTPPRREFDSGLRISPVEPEDQATSTDPEYAPRRDGEAPRDTTVVEPKLRVAPELASLPESDSAEKGEDDEFRLSHAVAFRAAPREEDVTGEPPEAAHIHVEDDDLSDDDGAETANGHGAVIFSHRARAVDGPREPALDAPEEPDAPDVEVATVVAPETAVAHAEKEAGEAETLELDDDQLREIVRRVLLDELTGPLGEKMTRNIRKMLKREVDRALALRDFD